MILAARGHLFRLAYPEEMDPRFKRWSFATLPVLPPRFSLKANAAGEQLVPLISQWLARPEISFVINACDPGREGELIFREIMQALRNTKPVKRLWLQSLTKAAICAGIEALRPGEDFQGLFASAAVRAKSDWLIGINATRAATVRVGRGESWPCGRVQTPALAFLVDRQAEIRAFKEARFWTIAVDLPAQPKSLIMSLRDGESAKVKQFNSASEAQQICQRLIGQKVTIEAQQASKTRKAPWPYNLLDLQKAMNTNHKWTAHKTLEVAQACYERHKVLSYPRTDSRALPSAFAKDALRIAHALQPEASRSRFMDVDDLEKRPYLCDQLVTDHHAIIPTGVTAKLSCDEQKLFQAVCLRFFAALSHDAVVLQTSWHCRFEELELATLPHTSIEQPGFLAWESSHESARPAPKATVSVESLSLAPRVEERLRRPPRAYSEAELLSAMERAGETLEDQAKKRQLVRAGGLGTAATRAQIIENLKKHGYASPDLHPTPKGELLIAFLRAAGCEELVSPQLTADLEERLTALTADPASENEVLRQAYDFSERLVEKLRRSKVPTQASGFHEIPQLAPTVSTPEPPTTIDKRVADCPIHGRDCGVMRLADNLLICETRFAKRLRGEAVEGFFYKGSADLAGFDSHSFAALIKDVMSRGETRP